MIQAYCGDCHNTFSLKDQPKAKAEVYKCIKCKKDCVLVYKVQFLVKDSGSHTNKHFYRVLLYSIEPHLGEDFFPDIGSKSKKDPRRKLPNLWLEENKDSLDKIKGRLNAMKKFNVYCEAILERRGSYFLIKNTQLREEFWHS